MPPCLTPPTKALYFSVDKRTGTLFMANARRARLQMADGACYIQPHSNGDQHTSGFGQRSPLDVHRCDGLGTSEPRCSGPGGLFGASRCRGAQRPQEHDMAQQRLVA
jgi:hypothetical protein